MVHVASWPPTHDVWPCVQLFVHVVEQTAAGEAPEHDWEDGHGVVVET